ncbi:hypothetical protein [Psychrosphaera aestuarii]|uniref:hypothetical protein n=1 Tax=Psychrosphaera aestuarii TaxID=1266052 RepID=UPI001B334F7C|nr:hypothetical protein [Psychrosphaera aestuarii]
MQPRLILEFLHSDPSKIWVNACNNSFAGETEQYINDQMLEVLSEQLTNFPKSVSDEVTLKAGDACSTHGYCELKFHCFDSTGHTAVLISVADDNENVAKFTVQFEASSLDGFVSSIKLALKSGSGVSELIGIKPYTQNV